MISGTSYECIDLTNLSSAGYRRALVFISSSDSRLLWICPFHRKIEVTDGIRLPQAASFFLTTASAISNASRRLDVVTKTITTFRGDGFIGLDDTPYLSKYCALPRNINDTHS